MKRLVVSMMVVSSLGGVVRADPADDPDPGLTHKRTAKVLAVSGAALLGTSLIIGLVERGNYYKAVARMNENGADAEAARHDANDAVWVSRYVGSGLFLAGAAAVVTAGIFYVTAPSRPTEKATALVPAVGGDQVGLALTGAF